MRAIIIIASMLLLAFSLNRFDGLGFPANVMLTLSITQTIILFSLLVKLERHASADD